MINPVRKTLVDLQIGSLVKKQAKKNREVIYGAQAIKHQIFLPYARETMDYDVLSKTPRASARELEATLDRKSGGDWFYTKPAMHPGTWKVMDKGPDARKGTKDDIGIADYTKMRPVKTRLVNGVRFVRLSEVRKDKRASLKDPEFAFRHPKDREDIHRMAMGSRMRRLFSL